VLPIATYSTVTGRFINTADFLTELPFSGSSFQRFEARPLKRASERFLPWSLRIQWQPFCRRASELDYPDRWPCPAGQAQTFFNHPDRGNTSPRSVVSVFPVLISGEHDE